MANKEKTKLQIAQESAQAALDKTNDRIGRLGEYTNDLYETLIRIQTHFDIIRNVPSEKWLEYEEIKKIRLNWRRQAEKIEEDYKNAMAKNVGFGAAGAGAGVAVAAMGPTAAMGFATTFGVASTGTAISTLSGAAATNAALAWLGGGALIHGGGGIVAGKALLALAGPVGWAISGVALLTSGILMWKKNDEKKRLVEIFTVISERDIRKYELAMVELNERIDRIIDENSKLNEAIDKIKTFGIDYNVMTRAQQYELGAYVNLMNSSTQLLVNPILGLQPAYTEEDYDKYDNWMCKKTPWKEYVDHKDIIIGLANFLYKIELNEKDEKLLWKTIKHSKEKLESLNTSKKELSFFVFGAAVEALKYKELLEMRVGSGTVEQTGTENGDKEESEEQ